MTEDGLMSQADIDALTMGLLGGQVDNLDAIRPATEVLREQFISVLKSVLGRSVDLVLNGIKAIDKESLGKIFASEGLLLRSGIEKGLPGELDFLIKQSTGAILADLMIMGDGKTPFCEDHFDALNELGNQMIGSFCTALGSKYGMSITGLPTQSIIFPGEPPPFEGNGWAQLDLTLSVEGFPDEEVKILVDEGLVNGFTGQEKNSEVSMGSSAVANEYDHETSEEPATTSRAVDTYENSLVNTPANVKMLLDIPLNVTIELGRTRLSIRKILELGPGSIIELDRLAGEPVDLLVNEKIVATGEVVVVDEYFGIRILTMVSPEERIRQLR